MDEQAKPIGETPEKREVSRRKFLRYVGAGAIGLGASSVLAACGGQQPTAAPAAQPTAVPNVNKLPKTDLNIAVIRWDPGDIYFNGVQLGQELERKRIQTADGVKINFNVFGKNDVSAQITALQDQLTRGVDGVLLVPWRGEAMVPLVTEIHNKGIPCVTSNAWVPKAPSVFVAFDNQEAGKLAGQAIVDKLTALRGPDWMDKEGVLIELRCIITASFDIGRHTGYHQVFDPIVKDHPNLKIEVRECGCDDAQARKAVDDLISRYGKDKILCVASVDGTMGIGAIPSLKAAGIFFPPDDPRHVPVTTVDASQPELQAIAKGELTHSSEQPAVGEGIMTMRLLYKMIKDGKLIEKPSAPSVIYENGDETGAKEPWMPVQVIPSDAFDGPWYKTRAFSVPKDLPVNDHGHWANIMVHEEKGEWPDWAQGSTYGGGK